jgi:hypothetical protein
MHDRLRSCSWEVGQKVPNMLLLARNVKSAAAAIVPNLRLAPDTAVSFESKELN